MSRHRRPPVRQSNSHRQLLGRAVPVRVPARDRLSLPAIIVPAGRRAANLDHAITLARAVQCHLVLLCSKDARTEEVHAFLDDRSFGDATVVNVPSDRDPFGFKTTRWVQEALPKECGHRDSDLSVKRNIGLAIARMLGWERIFFMDDDIRDIDSHAVLRTVSMLGWKQSYPAKYNAVGMRVTQFPDNSVACHANRLTGEFQDVFISGSALAVDCTESFGFFPDIYNEDWLFFYKDAVNGHLGSSGVAATQLRYDPFANPHRAASEEFGDVIAEGLYALLEHGTKAEAVTEDDWQGFLDSRRSLLSTILGRQDEAPAEVREHMADSIRAALASLRCITPDMCIEYVKQWQDDLTLWARVLRQLPRTTIIEDALAQLGLATAGHSPRARPDDISIPAAAPPGPAAVPWSRRD